MKVWMRFLTTLTALVLSPLAVAQSMHNLDALQMGADHSVNYQNAVAMRFDVAGFSDPSTASAVMVTPTIGFAAAHLFQQSGFSLSGHRVLTGANYNSPDRTVSVVDYGVFPGWSGQISGQNIDIAWFRISEALDVPTLNIGTAGVGDIITYTGYGRPATPGGGSMPFDGTRRSFETRLDGFGLADTADFYMGGFFRPSSSPYYLELGGGGMGGGSGSGGFNEHGELVSILALNSGGPGYFMASYGVSLQHEDVNDWVMTVIPAPGTLLVLGGLGFTALRRRR